MSNTSFTVYFLDINKLKNLTVISQLKQPPPKKNLKNKMISISQYCILGEKYFEN